MKILLKILSALGLLLTLLPAILTFNGIISFDQYKLLMLIGAILWFTTAPFWVDEKKETL